MYHIIRKCAYVFIICIHIIVHKRPFVYSHSEDLPSVMYRVRNPGQETEDGKIRS